MSAKRHVTKKSTRTKKLLHDIAQHETMHEGHHEEHVHREHNEEEIVKQFELIKKDYRHLMSEVVKEFQLVKDWVQKEAREKSNEFMSKMPVGFMHRIPIKIK